MSNDSFLPFGPARPASDDLSPELRRVGRQAYRQGWAAYHEVGCPFGTEDKAMLIWFAFNDRGLQTAFTVGRN